MLRVVCSFSFPNLHADEDSEANLASLSDFKKAKGTGHLQVLKTVKKAFHVNSGKHLEIEMRLCPRQTPTVSPVMSQAPRICIACGSKFRPPWNKRSSRFLNFLTTPTFRDLSFMRAEVWEKQTPPSLHGSSILST